MDATGKTTPRPSSNSAEALFSARRRASSDARKASKTSGAAGKRGEREGRRKGERNKVRSK